MDNLSSHDIEIEQIIADAAYSSGEVLRFCQQQHINAFIPNFGQYKNEREGFVYNEEKDQYECTRGNKAILPFRKIKASHDKHLMKVYRSNNSKCKNCPLRSECIGKSDFKKIEHIIHKPLYDEIHWKLQTPYAKSLMRRRSSTVEPVLDTLLNFLNLKKVNTRGIRQANKHVLMAAMTYNLKKYMKFISRKPHSMILTVEEASVRTTNFLFGLFYRFNSLPVTTPD